MILEFTKRNLLIYFRDKQAVFFSMMGVLIVFGLYILFLKDMWMDTLQGVPNATFLMNSWVMAGVLAITSITTTLGASGILIEDMANKISKDFKSSPLSRFQLVGSYILSTFIIGLIMSLIAFVLSEAYIVADGGKLLSLTQSLEILAIIPLAVLSSSALIFFIVSFINSSQAFSAVNVVIGTLVGFITGTYMPISSLPGAMQTVVEVFPVSHAAVLYRQIFMDVPISESFAGADQSVIDSFCLDMGINFAYGDYVSTPLFSIAVLCITAVVFYALAIIIMSLKRN